MNGLSLKQKLHDFGFQSIMERFSCSSIQDPTAFTSNDPMEMYNNILAFVVNGRAGARSEMHIFQCHDVGAQDLVEDLNHIRYCLCFETIFFLNRFVLI